MIRRFIAATLIGWALASACARADTLDTLRIVMYAGEAADCVNSGDKKGGYEVNPLVRPFSHGGVPMYCGAGAAGAAIVGALTRRWPKWLKIAGTGLQIGSNAWGITYTNTHAKGSP